MLQQVISRSNQVTEIIETAARAAGDHCKSAVFEQCCESEGEGRKGKGGGQRNRSNSCWEFPSLWLFSSGLSPLGRSYFTPAARGGGLQEWERTWKKRRTAQSNRKGPWLSSNWLLSG